MRMTMVIGLTGSFGSGKSTVAGMFRELGVPTLDADVAAREVVLPGTPALKEIVEAFGPDVLAADGTLDRKKMADLAFGDANARKKLNAIVHPRVGERIANFLTTHSSAPAVVLEIPLLLEGGRKAPVNKVAVVTTDERSRFARLKRSGFSEKEVIARLGSQMSQVRKAALADFVIHNEGDIEETRRQVRETARACGLDAGN